MARKKYEEVKGYWVYSISIPSVGKFYIGVSKLQCSQRWNKSTYKDNSLEPYLDEWENMVKTVIQDNLTKEEAYQLEDALIQALNDLCINERRSGLITNDVNGYKRELYNNNTEYREREKQRSKQWQLDNPNYQKQYRENNPEYRERNNQRSKQWQKDNKEKKREYDKQRYEKKKLEQQNQQLNLF